MAVFSQVILYIITGLFQLIVQRCLSAKDMVHAKGGTVLAAALKIISLPLFVIPGMISRILFTGNIPYVWYFSGLFNISLQSPTCSCYEPLINLSSIETNA